MATALEVAARHGGVPARCRHLEAGYCRRCPVPLHCVCDRDGAFQFGSAAAAVGFVREYGAIAAEATRAALRSRYAR